LNKSILAVGGPLEVGLGWNGQRGEKRRENKSSRVVFYKYRVRTETCRVN